MLTEIKCPHCLNNVDVDESIVGTRWHCPSCNNYIQLKFQEVPRVICPKCKSIYPAPTLESEKTGKKSKRRSKKLIRLEVRHGRLVSTCPHCHYSGESFNFIPVEQSLDERLVEKDLSAITDEDAPDTDTVKQVGTYAETDSDEMGPSLEFPAKAYIDMADIDSGLF